MIDKLWGDNYFDTKAKKWKNHDKADEGENKLKRVFVAFIMEPIIRLCRAIMNNEKDKIIKITTTLNIKMTNNELILQGKYLMKNIF